MDKQATLAKLRSQLRALEGRSIRAAEGASFGVLSLDAALPNGLSLGAVHEFYGDGSDIAAATGFIAASLTLLPKGPLVWIATDTTLYIPGLIPFGTSYPDLLFVQTRGAKDSLWAMEEALRWPGLRAVVAEIDNFDLTATRRLQLAAEDGGVTGFILARRQQGLTSGSTRWHITSVNNPDDAVAVPAWHVQLLRNREGPTAHCTLRWAAGKFQQVDTEMHTAHRVAQ